VSCRLPSPLAFTRVSTLHARVRAPHRRFILERLEKREAAMRRNSRLPPVHPGEIIKEDILPSVGLSVTAAAKALGVSRQMLHDILAERRPLSAVMCLKMARLFGGSPEVWMRLQAAYDLKRAEKNKKIMQRVSRIVPVRT
jgi:addiction module HigA family antidote